jgi:hypothetical protein
VENRSPVRHRCDACKMRIGSMTEKEWTMYQRLVFDFFSLGLLQKREIAGRLGLARFDPNESQFDYGMRILLAAKEAGKLTELAELVRTYHLKIAA